ncbi:MAG: hypothetical protein RR424_09780 [Oscillospiraceae bacterium]
MFENVVLGFCVWDILAALLLAAVVVAFVVQQKNHKKRMKQYSEMQNTEET